MPKRTTLRQRSKPVSQQYRVHEYPPADVSQPFLTGFWYRFQFLHIHPDAVRLPNKVSLPQRCVPRIQHKHLLILIAA
jgi:hypothetical protein